MNVTTPLPWLALCAMGVPLAYAAAAFLVSSSRPFKSAQNATSVALGLTGLVLTGWALAGRGVHAVDPSGSTLGALAPSVRLDVVTALMLPLITFVGFILVRFSRRYLDGDPGRARYARWMMATLAAVSVLVIANNLLWLGLAWVCTSLSLHQLLTFFRDRPQALIAAHKKFLVSRIADVSLLGGIGLLGASVGSYELDTVHAWAATRGSHLPFQVELAALLFVLGAALKSAQLPFHGWLTQVMEAPTPVSALLHAGIVNIGGFLMIRLGPLMVHAELAQTLLVIIGTTTAVLAALVMNTRSSVKVTLAWSTCAQMGFMLVQCGLGAYHLALLHLIAHSLYKAHAFLSSGSTVDVWRAQATGARCRAPSLSRWLLSLPVSAVGVGAAAMVFGVTPEAEPALWALGTVLVFALTPLLTRDAGGRLASASLLAVSAFAAASLYFAWSHAFRFAVPETSDPTSLQLAWVIVGFVTLFTIQAILRTRPDGAFARSLLPVLRAGLYLDEVFTRTTFRIWPAKLPVRQRAQSLPSLETRKA